MGTGIVFFLDEENQERVKSVWKTIADSGIPNELLVTHSPAHICFNVFSSTPSHELLSLAKEQISSFSPIKIQFHSVGAFLGSQGTVYLAPLVTEELLSVHKRWDALFGQFEDDKCGIYLPEFWVPHCTLAMNIKPSDIPKVIEIAQQAFQPFEAILDQVGFGEFPPADLWDEFILPLA